MNFNFIKRFFGFQHTSLTAFGRTDTGRKRQRNEDSFCLMPKQRLFLVADGMGGHKAGDVASETAVEELADYFMAHKLHTVTKQEIIRHTMISGFHAVNEIVMNRSRRDPALQGMGCTLIACYVSDSIAYLCHVGDVRGYQISSTSLRQLTHDHTYAAALQKGTQAAGAKKVPKNILNRAIGFPFKEDPEFNQATMIRGNRLLLCSDGLWGMVADRTLHQLTLQSDNPEAACDMAIQEANKAGGKDNITAVYLFWD